MVPQAQAAKAVAKAREVAEAKQPGRSTSNGMWAGATAGLAVSDGCQQTQRGHSHSGGGLDSLRRQALHIPAAEAGTIRRMKIAGVKSGATVSGTTKKKHVAAAGEQAAKATAEFGSMTFVEDEQLLIAAVDADGWDFPADAGASLRKDVVADVKISQWEKTGGSVPGGMAKGQPSTKTIDGVVHSCEIGAVKTGDGRISITHFKKL
jgi:hypothetical protein